MAEFNAVHIVGRLARDPESRQLPSGAQKCSFRIASNRTYNVQGEKRQDVTWVDVEAWNKTGELCQQYLKKGSEALITGRLCYDAWEDKDGNKRSKHYLTADRVQFLGGKREAQEEAREEREAIHSLSDEDLPF